MNTETPMLPSEHDNHKKQQTHLQVEPPLNPISTDTSFNSNNDYPRLPHIDQLQNQPPSYHLLHSSSSHLHPNSFIRSHKKSTLHSLKEPAEQMRKASSYLGKGESNIEEEGTSSNSIGKHSKNIAKSSSLNDLYRLNPGKRMLGECSSSNHHLNEFKEHKIGKRNKMLKENLSFQNHKGSHSNLHNHTGVPTEQRVLKNISANLEREQKQKISEAGSTVNVEKENKRDVLSIDDVRVKSHLGKYFDYPISEAAAMLNCSVTRLKQVSRKIGIKRWPYRKVNSLNTQIHLLEIKLKNAQSNSDKQSILKQTKLLKNEVSSLKYQKIEEEGSVNETTDSTPKTPGSIGSMTKTKSMMSLQSSDDMSPSSFHPVSEDDSKEDHLPRDSSHSRGGRFLEDSNYHDTNIEVLSMKNDDVQEHPTIMNRNIPYRHLPQNGSLESLQDYYQDQYSKAAQANMKHNTYAMDYSGFNPFPPLPNPQMNYYPPYPYVHPMHHMGNPQFYPYFAQPPVPQYYSNQLYSQPPNAHPSPMKKSSSFSSMHSYQEYNNNNNNNTLQRERSLFAAAPQYQSDNNMKPEEITHSNNSLMGSGESNPK